MKWNVVQFDGKIDNTNKVYLPKQIRDIFNLKAGDEVKIKFNSVEGMIAIQKKNNKT